MFLKMKFWLFKMKWKQQKPIGKWFSMLMLCMRLLIKIWIPIIVKVPRTTNWQTKEVGLSWKIFSMKFLNKKKVQILNLFLFVFILFYCLTNFWTNVPFWDSILTKYTPANKSETFILHSLLLIAVSLIILPLMSKIFT